MTREQVKQLFPDATDEQITRLLNVSQTELSAEKQKVKDLQTKASEADQLRQQLEDAQNGDNSELEKAKQRIAELEKQNLITAKKKDACEQFHISAEQAEKVIDKDGNIDFTALGQIISEKETAAATAKEQELASKAGNPGGGTGGGAPDTRSNAEKLASKVLATNDGKKDNIISHYLGGN